MTDRSIWINLLRTQDKYLPLPTTLRLSQLSTPQVESVAITTQRIAKSWPAPRPEAPRKLQPKSGEVLLGIELYLDKWLLSVYSDGLVYLWDVANSSIVNPGVRCASLDLGSRGWTSYVSSLDASNTSIFLAVTRSQGYVDYF